MRESSSSNVAVTPKNTNKAASHINLTTNSAQSHPVATDVADKDVSNDALLESSTGVNDNSNQLDAGLLSSNQVSSIIFFRHLVIEVLTFHYHLAD